MFQLPLTESFSLAQCTSNHSTSSHFLSNQKYTHMSCVIPVKANIPI